MPLSLGLRLGLSASTSAFGWVTLLEGAYPAVAFNGTQFALPAYGPELVTNGGFDTDTTGWTAETCTLSVVAGAIRITSTTNGTAAWVARQDRDTVPGKLYEARATFVGSGGPNVTAARLEIRRTDGTSIAVSPAPLPSNGTTLTVYFTALDTTTRVRLRGETGAGGVSGSSYVDYDNVSVREVRLGEMGANLGASGYTMSVNGGTGTATESPTGTLNLTGDGTNRATGEKSITCVVGRHYRVVCLVGTSAANIRVGTTTLGAQTVPETIINTGVAHIEFTATATTHFVSFLKTAAALATISSITIAEWTPRPTLRTASFSEVFAFTASSTTARTYVGSDGLIKNDLAADAPRVDYSNGKARYLFENQSTNLFQRSQEVDNAYWTKSGSTITADATTSPDGTVNADKLAEDTSTGAHRIQRSDTKAASALPYTISVYLKAAERTLGYVSFDDGGANGVSATFDLSNGTISIAAAVTGTFNSPSATISPAANGFYRCTVTGTTNTGTTIRSNVLTYNGGTSFTGTSGSGIFVYGLQLEQQAFASSYIPTTTATVTRLIETAELSPLVEAISNLPGVTLRVQGTARSAKVNQRIIGTATTGAILRADGSTASTIGTGTGSLTATSILPGPFGAAVAINSSGQSLSANGGAATSSITAAASRAVLYLARGGTVDASNPYGDGWYNSFAVYPFRAADANLPSATAAPT